MKRFFIITVDTEGDNLWDYREGDMIRTENALAIPRFQDLCEQYGFKPVYLTNYEMIRDDRFVEYIKTKAEAGLCEVGIHIHAWNNPPFFELKQEYKGNPYLIEYPYSVMKEKFAMTYNLIKKRIGIAPVSHRAGRWVMNDDYFNLLKEFDIRIDCSYTPMVSWVNSPGQSLACGCDYSCAPKEPHVLKGVLEVPMTIRKLRYCSGESLKHRVRTLISGKTVWLRPALSSLQDMKKLCHVVSKEKETDYIEFMIHSSELLAGGSPYFKTETAIHSLFSDMNQLFTEVSLLGYRGIKLADYYIHNKVCNS